MSEFRKIPISQPCVGDDELKALSEPVKSGWLTQGPNVAKFERLFAEKHEVSHALAVTSCTTALFLALKALGVGPGDEVIVPAFTWVSTANVVIHCGAKPVLVDVNPLTFNIDPSKISSKLSKKTKAIIPVHLFGLCADIDLIRAAIPANVKIIEDAACAAGAIYKEKYAGSLGEAAAFSFHPRKTITTGEGGMVTTNNAELSEKINILRNHGASISEEQRHLSSKPYVMPEFNDFGFNFRMTDLQGAIGYIQTEKLQGFISERAKWANYYRENLSQIDWLRLPDEPKEGAHAWQAFVTYIKPRKAPQSRNQIMDSLQKKGIFTRPGTHALHLLGAYQRSFNFNPLDFPIAKKCDDNTMAIPLHNCMKEEDFAFVVKSLKEIC